MLKDGGVDAPISLGGFFSSDDDLDQAHETQAFEQIYEVQLLNIGGVDLQIRQSAWHMANANKVWPGTFALAEYIKDHINHYISGRILELGSATGAFAIYLSTVTEQCSIVTSDIDDHGEVEDNIAYNYKLNGLTPVSHVAHTWGTGWPTETSIHASSFKFIVASDILLYVSAYEALVYTINELFNGGTVKEFLMSWNRRIAESGIFFSLMEKAGYKCTHHGRCVYSFARTSDGSDKS